MKSFEETGWWRDRHYYIYRKLNHSKEVFPIVIDNISEGKVYVTCTTEYGCEIWYHMANVRLEDNSKYDNYKFWFELDDPRYEMFQLEVEELMNFI
jgi:hypothetical protein